jgi:ketosteroid isomerase-like protein
VLGPGKLPDPATAELLPEFFDPDVEVRQMTSLVGTAGNLYGYRGLMESNRERLQVNLSFEAEELSRTGNLVATVAVVRGTGLRSGTPFEARVVHLFTLRHGRVVLWEVFDDPADALKAVRR